jgi:hypothetical protein
LFYLIIFRFPPKSPHWQVPGIKLFPGSNEGREKKKPFLRGRIVRIKKEKRFLLKRMVS